MPLFPQVSGEANRSIAGAVDAVAVTPDNTTEFTAGTCRALYVGGAGNISVLMASGNAVTFVGVTAGTVLPFQIRRVNSTSTTATSMVALY